jgi:hypothetical protein
VDTQILGTPRDSERDPEVLPRIRNLEVGSEIYTLYSGSGHFVLDPDMVLGIRKLPFGS